MKLSELKGSDGYYYLHTNGDLIYKKFMPELDSDFVVKVWAFDKSQRGHAWIIAIEALALGANKERIFELKEKWGLTDSDAGEFVKEVGLFNLFLDQNMWCATFSDFTNLQESQAGFGDTALEAFADLAKQGLMEAQAS